MKILSLLMLLISIGCSSTNRSSSSTSDYPFTLNLIFNSHLEVKAAALVNSGNTQFEFFGGGARILTERVGLIEGKSLPEYLRNKYGSMEVGGAIFSNQVGNLKGQFKYIVHVSAVHTAGSPKKSLIPRKLHSEHPIIMGSYSSVYSSILSALLVANKNNVRSINIPPLAQSRGVSKKISIEALKDALDEYVSRVKHNNIKKINYVIYIKKEDKETSLPYIKTHKQAWANTWANTWAHYF